MSDRAESGRTTGPLDGADIGETRTVRESVELYTIDFKPDVYFGSDRIGRATAAGVEVAEDEDGYETVVVTFEGEITKALPRRWDWCREPRTATEKKAQRRKRWLGKAATAFGVLLPLGIATGFTYLLMGRMEGRTIETGPMQPPGLEFYAGLIAFILFLLWAIPKLPGAVGRRFE